VDARHHQPFNEEVMPMANSTTQKKPKKPYPEFPLFPHATKRWAKKIRGKFVYFGSWNDGPEAALRKYLDQKEDLHAGRTPRNTADGLAIGDLCNRFLTTKKRLLNASEITDRTFRDYYSTCSRIVDAFGRDRLVDDLAADDFESFRASMAQTLGPVALGNEVSKCRMVFKYGYDQDLIDKPLRYGQSFNRPSRRVLRVSRSKNGKRMFEADELRTIIETASQPIKAMSLLGINCGFGNTDVAMLSRSVIDLDNGWIDYPRPKTGIERRCHLWPETIASLREAIEQRPKPKNKADDDLCFLTRGGSRWVRTSDHEDPGKRAPMDFVAKQFGRLLKTLSINGRKGLNFYAIRHTFETIGGESKDQVAVNAIMGHVDSSMAGVYRERISDERLRAVTDTVRAWLWPESTKPAEPE
jgi:integrase